MYKRTLSFVIAGLMFATAATPCGFHNYAPQPTLVDQLLSSDDIVLARQAPGNPFKFQAIEALEGSLAASEIPFLVDSTTRRQLALDANAAVLFARDGAYGPWQRLAFIDAAMAPVLRTVMTRLPVWEFGEDFDRFSYFASLVEHDDNRIHQLALRELDQADYSVLRNLQPEIDTARLLAQIDDPYQAEFKAIRILLLGLGGEGHLRNWLETGLKKNLSDGSLYLGAYATALIELVGPEGVTYVASNYLTDRNLPLFTRELLLEALALHGQTGEAAMEAAISGAVRNALWIDPDLAGAVARRFGSRGDWSHFSALETLYLEGAIYLPADKQDVSEYLTFARDSGVRPEQD